MSRRSRLAGQLAMLALVGLLVVAFPAGFALAQDLADPGATTQSNHTLVPIINLTSTPTETPTATATQTATPTPTATATPTPTSGGGGDGGDGDTSGDGQRLVVAGGSGVAGGVTSDEDCSNPEYKTIQRAVDDASPGDTVVVCAGTYPESVTIETAGLTLKADGEVQIESTGQPAVRTTASQVTIRGFNVSAEQSSYVIAIGGRDSLIGNNTVKVTGNQTGIFFSDGRTPEGGEPDLDLAAAIGSRALNNTITIPQTAESESWGGGVFTDADRTVIRDNTIIPNDDSTFSIRSSGNRTLIQENVVRHPGECSEENCGGYTNPPAIIIGKKHEDWEGSTEGKPCFDDVTYDEHNWARDNRLINNSVIHSPGFGLYITGTGEHNGSTDGLVARDNYFYQTNGVGGGVDEALFQNNTIDLDSVHTGESTSRQAGRFCLHLRNSRLIGNYVQDGGYITGQNITIKRNTFDGKSLAIAQAWYHPEHPTESVRVINEGPVERG